MSDLFEAGGLPNDAPRPLADRLRPKTLAEVVGQNHLIGPDGPIGRMVAANRPHSIILWGPPGTGKTTIARLLSTAFNLHFEQLSAVFSGVADLKKAFEAARQRRKVGQGTLLFVDEIHRFNRSQQDSFLPVVEDGTVVLVGATTENPSFELNGALLSRAQVLVLRRLDDAAQESLLQRAEKHYGEKLPLTDDARQTLRAMADGDGRYLLNLAEEVAGLKVVKPMDSAALVAAVQRRMPLYDKSREEHYNLISALHKSIRGSDPDAALYWMARMLAGGEQPLYIARRLVRASVEDIGLADPQAVVQALAAKDVYDFLGSPEGELALVQCVLYLASAPKSNAVYTAYGAAKRSAEEHGSLMPPAHILNAPTKLMKNLGYGKGYEYDHDAEDGFSGKNYFPDGMARQNLYQPKDTGFEREIQKRLDYWAKLHAPGERIVSDRMDDLFRLSGTLQRDPRIEAWFSNRLDPHRLMVKIWFERMRDCGADLRELLHDGCPVACVEDAPFGYVNAFKAHASVGFFHGAALPDAAGLLEGEGKRMRHVKLRPGKPLDEAALNHLIAAAYKDIRESLG